MIRNLHFLRSVSKTNFQWMVLTPVGCHNFSAVGGDSVTRNYIKFKTKYDQHVKAFHEKLYESILFI